MYPVNLYLLSRLCEHNDLEKFIQYECHVSKRKEKAQIKQHEVQTLDAFVNSLIISGALIKNMEHFYYSYSIPQIGKEFDLLKIYDNLVLNIELKSATTVEKIEEQLKKNQYYLSHFSNSRKVVFFTYVQEGNKFYTLFKDNVVETKVDEIVSILNDARNCFSGDLDSQFRVSDFLVSPLNTPQRFYDNAYFLNRNQQDVKKSIEKNIEKNIGCIYNFYEVQGGAGTGKTLLLYDIAKNYCDNYKVCVIHCGLLSEGHYELMKLFSNLTIMSPRTILTKVF